MITMTRQAHSSSRAETKASNIAEKPGKHVRVPVLKRPSNYRGNSNKRMSEVRKCTHDLVKDSNAQTGKRDTGRKSSARKLNL